MLNFCNLQCFLVSLNYSSRILSGLMYNTGAKLILSSKSYSIHINNKLFECCLEVTEHQLISMYDVKASFVF